MYDNQQSSKFNDFFSFRKFISLTFIQIIYVLGAIAITIAGIVLITQVSNYGYGVSEGGGVLSGLGLIIVGNLLWRVICEAWILFFRLAVSVGNIENGLRNSSVYSTSSAINQTTENNLPSGASWKCPKCQSTNPGSTYKCDHCGYSLV